MDSTTWTRPDTVTLPTIWRRVQAKKPMPNGKIIHFRIQDVVPEMHEDVINHMSTHFLRDEIISRCTRLSEDELSLKELQDLWRDSLKQNMALVALVEEDGDYPKIAGANVTTVYFKDQKKSSDYFKGKALRTVMRLLIEEVDSHFDVFEHFGVDKYLGAVGLSVDPAFRGQGLGLEILRARFDLGRAVGLELTVTPFTGITSQILAHKLDFEVLVEITYDEYEDNHEKPFVNDTTKSMKVMAKKIEK